MNGNSNDDDYINDNVQYNDTVDHEILHNIHI